MFDAAVYSERRAARGTGLGLGAASGLGLPIGEALSVVYIEFAQRFPARDRSGFPPFRPLFLSAAERVRDPERIAAGLFPCRSGPCRCLGMQFHVDLQVARRGDA